MIDQITIDRILDAAQIMDVVSDFVTLRKRGVNYVGLCPFHSDKTPSFYVSPAKGLCKCFACGKGGNAVHFIMEHEQMSYPEALKYLAKKYNIEIKERELSDEEKFVQSERESLFIVNNFARDYFQNILKNHVDGRSIGMAYFRNRGFRDDIIEKFQLGYCTEAHFPAKWWLLGDVYLPVQRKGLKLNTSIRPNRKFTTKVTSYTVYILPNRLL